MADIFKSNNINRDENDEDSDSDIGYEDCDCPKDPNWVCDHICCENQLYSCRHGSNVVYHPGEFDEPWCDDHSDEDSQDDSTDSENY